MSEPKALYDAGIDDRPVIRFQGLFVTSKNMADGSPRFTFDTPAIEQSIMAQAQLGMTKIDGVYLDIECRAHVSKLEDNDKQITGQRPQDRFEL